MDHLELLSDKIDATQRDVAEMKDFLLGSQFNEKKGIDLVKWFFTVMMTGIVGLLIYLIQQHK